MLLWIFSETGRKLHLLMEAVVGSSMEVQPQPHSINATMSNAQETISTQRQLQWCQGQGLFFVIITFENANVWDIRITRTTNNSERQHNVYNPINKAETYLINALNILLLRDFISIFRRLLIHKITFIAHTSLLQLLVSVKKLCCYSGSNFAMMTRADYPQWVMTTTPPTANVQRVRMTLWVK